MDMLVDDDEPAVNVTDEWDKIKVASFLLLDVSDVCRLKVIKCWMLLTIIFRNEVEDEINVKPKKKRKLKLSIMDSDSDNDGSKKAYEADTDVDDDEDRTPDLSPSMLDSHDVANTALPLFENFEFYISPSTNGSQNAIEKLEKIIVQRKG